MRSRYLIVSISNIIPIIDNRLNRKEEPYGVSTINSFVTFYIWVRITCDIFLFTFSVEMIGQSEI